MILTTTQLTEIVKAGGALVLDASLFTMRQLETITAAAATNSKAKLTVKNVAGMIPKHLIALSTLAPGQISFDLTTSVSKTPQ